MENTKKSKNTWLILAIVLTIITIILNVLAFGLGVMSKVAGCQALVYKWSDIINNLECDSIEDIEMTNNMLPMIDEFLQVLAKNNKKVNKKLTDLTCTDKIIGYSKAPSGSEGLKGYDYTFKDKNGNTYQYFSGDILNIGDTADIVIIEKFNWVINCNITGRDQTIIKDREEHLAELEELHNKNPKDLDISNEYKLVKYGLDIDEWGIYKIEDASTEYSNYLGQEVALYRMSPRSLEQDESGEWKYQYDDHVDIFGADGLIVGGIYYIKGNIYDCEHIMFGYKLIGTDQEVQNEDE